MASLGDKSRMRRQWLLCMVVGVVEVLAVAGVVTTVGVSPTDQAADDAEAEVVEARQANQTARAELRLLWSTPRAARQDLQVLGAWWPREWPTPSTSTSAAATTTPGAYADILRGQTGWDFLIGGLGDNDVTRADRASTSADGTRTPTTATAAATPSLASSAAVWPSPMLRA